MDILIPNKKLILKKKIFKMYKEVTCKKSGIKWRKYTSLQKCRCELCRKNQKKSTKKPQKPIRKVSEKQEKLNKEYSKLRLEFLSLPENQFCFIDGCNKKANTIEHRSGRWGSNYLDTSTWAGCCWEHNLELENNPELSKKYQLSKITGKPKI